jgi:hypothetical protein
VAICGSSVPVRADQLCGALDLSGCGCTRSASTGSISDSFRIVRSRSDGH